MPSTRYEGLKHHVCVCNTEVQQVTASSLCDYAGNTGTSQDVIRDGNEEPTKGSRVTQRLKSEAQNPNRLTAFYSMETVVLVFRQPAL